MKTAMTRAALGAMVACSMTACTTGFEKVSEGDVEAAQKAKAQALATRIYESCNSGTFALLSDDDAIPEMREGLSPAKMPSTCTGVKSQFGDYQSMDYAETWKSGSGKLHVYRFKGHFSKSADTPELRVVMDGPKLSGFWIKPWVDAMK